MRLDKPCDNTENGISARRKGNTHRCFGRLFAQPGPKCLNVRVLRFSFGGDTENPAAERQIEFEWRDQSALFKVTAGHRPPSQHDTGTLQGGIEAMVGVIETKTGTFMGMWYAGQVEPFRPCRNIRPMPHERLVMDQSVIE